MPMFVHIYIKVQKHKSTKHLDIHDQVILCPRLNIYSHGQWLIFSIISHKTTDFLSSRITIKNIPSNKPVKKSSLQSVCVTGSLSSLNNSGSLRIFVPSCFVRDLLEGICVLCVCPLLFLSLLQSFMFVHRIVGDVFF